MHHLIVIFAIAIGVGFAGMLVELIVFAKAPDWWIVGAAGVAILIYLAVVTRGFDALRPPNP